MGTSKLEDNKTQTVRKTQGITYPLSKRLYTLEEAGHYLGRTLWSMRELIWKGSLPIVRNGKRIFVDIKDMDIFIEKSKTVFL
jgi:hypothetical protein